MQTHRFSKPSDIFLPPPLPPCASLSKGFSRKIAAKILWVMAAHKVGCGPFPPRSIYPPLPSKTTPWPGHSSHSAHFLRRIFGDTSNDGGRHSRFLISRIISFPLAPPLPTISSSVSRTENDSLIRWMKNEIFSAPPISYFHSYPNSSVKIRFSGYRYRVDKDRVGIIRFVNETVNDAINFNFSKKKRSSFQVSFEKRTTPRATVDKPSLRSDNHFWHVEHTRVISDSNEIHRAGIELAYPYTLRTIYDSWNDVLPE